MHEPQPSITGLLPSISNILKRANPHHTAKYKQHPYIAFGLQTIIDGKELLHAKVEISLYCRNSDAEEWARTCKNTRSIWQDRYTVASWCRSATLTAVRITS